MPDRCTDNPRDCPLAPRVEALEEANKQHGSTHREIFGRLGALETENAVQNAHWTNVNGKLDSLTDMVQKLTDKINEVERKPAKRWENIVDKTIWAVCAAVIAFLFGRIGL